MFRAIKDTASATCRSFNASNTSLFSDAQKIFYKGSSACTTLGAVCSVSGNFFKHAFYGASSVLYGFYVAGKVLPNKSKKALRDLVQAHPYIMSSVAVSICSLVALGVHYHYGDIKELMTAFSMASAPIFLLLNARRFHHSAKALKKIEASENSNYTRDVLMHPATRHAIASVALGTLHAGTSLGVTGSWKDYLVFMSSLGLILNADIRWQFEEEKKKKV